MTALRELYEELRGLRGVSPTEEPFDTGYAAGYGDAIRYVLEGLEMIIEEEDGEWQSPV